MQEPTLSGDLDGRNGSGRQHDGRRRRRRAAGRGRDRDAGGESRSPASARRRHTGAPHRPASAARLVLEQRPGRSTYDWAMAAAPRMDPVGCAAAEPGRALHRRWLAGAASRSPRRRGCSGRHVLEVLVGRARAEGAAAPDRTARGAAPALARRQHCLPPAGAADSGARSGARARTTPSLADLAAAARLRVRNPLARAAASAGVQDMARPTEDRCRPSAEGDRARRQGGARRTVWLRPPKPKRPPAGSGAEPRNACPGGAPRPRCDRRGERRHPQRSRRIALRTCHGRPPGGAGAIRTGAAALAHQERRSARQRDQNRSSRQPCPALSGAAPASRHGARRSDATATETGAPRSHSAAEPTRRTIALTRAGAPRARPLCAREAWGRRRRTSTVGRVSPAAPYLVRRSDEP